MTVNSTNRTTRLQSKNKTKRTYCRFFNLFGRCTRGDACQFLHDAKRVSICQRWTGRRICGNSDRMLGLSCVSGFCVDCATLKAAHTRIMSVRRKYRFVRFLLRVVVIRKNVRIYTCFTGKTLSFVWNFQKGFVKMETKLVTDSPWAWFVAKS